MPEVGRILVRQNTREEISRDVFSLKQIRREDPDGTLSWLLLLEIGNEYFSDVFASRPGSGTILRFLTLATQRLKGR